MVIKNKKEYKEYKQVCDLSVEMLGKIRDFVKKGITTMDIENYSRNLCEKYNVKPAFEGVRMGFAPAYQYTTCISLNDTVVHGVPGEEIIKEGDIVKIDFGIVKNGYYSDHCFTVGVEPISEKDKTFILESRNAILKGVEAAVLGNTIGDIGHAIESYAQKHVYSVVKEFVGHSIGKSLHDLPDVPAHGRVGEGEKLRKGQLLCIEAQIVDGNSSVYSCQDCWSVKTRSGDKACMFEYIVMVDNKKPRILTNTVDWKLFV
jgi:methionyl aminopeptidase